MILIFQLEISRLMCICWHTFFNRYTYFCVSYIIVISERIRHILFKGTFLCNNETKYFFRYVVRYGFVRDKQNGGACLAILCDLYQFCQNTNDTFVTKRIILLSIFQRFCQESAIDINPLGNTCSLESMNSQEISTKLFN